MATAKSVRTNFSASPCCDDTRLIHLNRRIHPLTHLLPSDDAEMLKNRAPERVCVLSIAENKIKNKIRVLLAPTRFTRDRLANQCFARSLRQHTFRHAKQKRQNNEIAHRRPKQQDAFGWGSQSSEPLRPVGGWEAKK